MGQWKVICDFGDHMKVVNQNVFESSTTTVKKSFIKWNHEKELIFFLSKLLFQVTKIDPPKSI